MFRARSPTNSVIVGLLTASCGGPTATFDTACE
jgi:hypothetical protein